MIRGEIYEKKSQSTPGRGLTATLFLPIAWAMMLAVQKQQELRFTLKAEELARPSTGRGERVEGGFETWS